MTSFSQLEARLRDALAQLLWDQWVALGVGGGTIGKRVPIIVDPEALLLATTRFASGESRLMAEVMDWLVLNGHSISLARVKTLQTDSRIGDLDAIARETAWFAKTVQNALNELERSGHVHSRQTGREKSFSLTPSDWAPFIPRDGARAGWLPQGAFYAACSAMLEALQAADHAGENERLVSIALHHWTIAISHQVDAAGLPDDFARLVPLRGSELAAAFAKAVDAFINLRLNDRALRVHPFRLSADEL